MPDFLGRHPDNGKTFPTNQMNCRLPGQFKVHEGGRGNFLILTSAFLLAKQYNC